MKDEYRMPNDESPGSYDSPPEHIRSYDAAMDKALCIMCGCVGLMALVMIGLVVWGIYEAWKGALGA